MVSWSGGAIYCDLIKEVHYGKEDISVALRWRSIKKLCSIHGAYLPFNVFSLQNSETTLLTIEQGIETLATRSMVGD